MKKTILLHLILAFIIANRASSQVILSDDFSANNWTQLGNQFIASSSLPPGTLDIDLNNSNKLEYIDFRGGQTYRLIKNIPTTLNSNDKWRVEFNYQSFLSDMDYGLVFSVTDDTNAFHSDYSNSTNSNNCSGVHLQINDALGTNDQLSAKVRGKYLTNRLATSQPIQINKNTVYYFRIERTRPDNLILSIYSDSNRQNHINGSPVCYNLDSRITSLKYLQFGIATTAGWSRTANMEIDDLVMYANTIEECNVECDITPSMDIRFEECQYRFTNTSSLGQDNFFMGSVINFGDGTYQNIGEPGAQDNLLHSYSPSGYYTPCITTFSYIYDGEKYTCCSSTYCIEEFYAEECEFEDQSELITEEEPCQIEAGLDVEIDCNGNVTFNNFSQVISGNFLTSVVDFGDQSHPIEVSQLENFTHHYSPGSYEICITVFGYSITPDGSFECCEEEFCTTVEIPEPCPEDKPFRKKQNIKSNKIEELVIYPNPTSEILHIESEAKTLEYRIQNTIGQIVKEGIESGKTLYQLNLNDLERGIYIISIKYDNEMVTKKIIKN